MTSPLDNVIIGAVVATAERATANSDLEAGRPLALSFVLNASKGAARNKLSRWLRSSLDDKQWVPLRMRHEANLARAINNAERLYFAADEAHDAALRRNQQLIMAGEERRIKFRRLCEAYQDLKAASTMLQALVIESKLQRFEISLVRDDVAREFPPAPPPAPAGGDLPGEAHEEVQG
ncbi:uncharacterized protein SPSK_09823 [Sporothrix schenckii 1099-18]|uniref:Uncharacterized protein n=1 Tax=Sporothrix schenckii 1099-18 TaxID=1397361 RepID=A0A0F2M397_SPOSC|nr:uncharacterized protein SPSK_09823 [Sporothrix schenckii 1099-18]KJR84188.1 hypothetical protein SPSK_09823 [Sporothrix schenckii 1099-18]